MIEYVRESLSVFIFPQLRLHQCLREDVFCLLETGAACQTVKHHEGNQPVARQVADHAICEDGAELVRNQKLIKHLHVKTNVLPAPAARWRLASLVIFPHDHTFWS